MIRLNFRTEHGNFHLHAKQKISLHRFLFHVAGLMYVDVECFRLYYRGDLIEQDKTRKLTDLPDFQAGIIFDVEFNKTDYAREQIRRFAKRMKSQVSESKLTLKQQIKLQEQMWVEEGIREPFESDAQSVNGNVGSKIKTFFQGDKSSAKGKLKETIKTRSAVIEKALTHAYSVVPGLYTASPLLYVSLKINDVEVKACVDTGATETAMLMGTAEKCGILNLVDDGWAVPINTGIWKAEAMGRVHHTKFELGEFSGFFHISVITDGDTEVLLGLDFLKFFKVNVNTADNCLEFKTGEIVEFLHASENPENEGKRYFVPHYTEENHKPADVDEDLEFKATL